MEHLASIEPEYYAVDESDDSLSSDEEQLDLYSKTGNSSGDGVSMENTPGFPRTTVAIGQRRPRSTNWKEGSTSTSKSKLAADEFAMDCELELTAAFEQHNQRWMEGIDVQYHQARIVQIVDPLPSIAENERVKEIIDPLPMIPENERVKEIIGPLPTIPENEQVVEMVDPIPKLATPDVLPTTSSAGLERSTPRMEKVKKDSKTKPAKPAKKREEGVDPVLALNGEDLSDDEFQKVEGLAQPTDDDLLYDPDLDAGDQAWIDKHRRSYLPKADKHKALPNSDAVLNCPACMTVLCMDCQRHEVYKTQYRAMFVLNCMVSDKEPRHCPVKKRGGRKLRKRKLSGDDEEDDASAPTPMEEVVPENAKREDIFHPVLCEVCKTEVAVFDSDEVYHFHNTLASHA